MNFNILAEAQTDNFIVARKATSWGGQYNGRCILPGCTSQNDALRIHPNRGRYGHFECSKCGRKGSGIDYLMLMRGYSKQKALAEVGWTPKDGSTPHFIIPEHLLSDESHSTHDAPSKQWQEAAKSFYQRCGQVLWSEQGKEALAYLHSRGFTDKTLKAACIGYHPLKEWEPGDKWGCEEDVLLRRGIVIPWIFDSQTWRITIRDESVIEGNGRYKQVSGGSNGLYLADLLDKYHRPVVLVEGEFDALSIAQTCGDLVCVCATGTTEGSHTTKWLALLARQSHVLIAFDAEKEKGDEAVKWWSEKLENAQRLRPLWDDANQMLQDGVNLREDWLLPKLQEIEASAQATEPAPQPEQPEVDADQQEPEEEQPIAEETASFTQDDAPLPRGDFWTSIHTRLARSSIASGTPFYEELRNWRPDDKAYAHIQGGREGYRRLYQKKGEAA